MAKKIQAPVKTPYRRQSGYKWYVYVLVGFASLCLLLSALVVSLMLAKDNSFLGSILPNILHRGKNNNSRHGINKREDFNVLIAGLDGEGDSRRTDSIIIGHVSMKKNYANFVFFPRDSFVDIPGHGRQKINAAYPLGGQALLRETLENIFGIHIDYYFIVDINAFIKLIDAMGGVDVYVEKNMRYKDRSQGLYIDLQQGMQHMDGEHAMQYSRFRHDAEGDFGRIRRQQKLLFIFAKKFLSPTLLKRAPEILNTLEGEQNTGPKRNAPIVNTNLSIDEIAMLTGFYNKTVHNNINAFALLGATDMVHGMSIVIPDMPEARYLVAGALKGGYHPDNRTVKIEVLNGCRGYNIADVYARRLGYYGFDIVRQENADHFDYDTTTVIVHRKRPFGEAVARLLDAKLESAPEPGATADLTVVIGRDKLRSD